MSRNEAQTRLELVDPCLVDQRGWPRANIRVEVTAAAVDIRFTHACDAFAGKLL